MTPTPSDQFGLFRYTSAFINYLSFKMSDWLSRLT